MDQSKPFLLFGGPKDGATIDVTRKHILMGRPIKIPSGKPYPSGKPKKYLLTGFKDEHTETIWCAYVCAVVTEKLKQRVLAKTNAVGVYDTQELKKWCDND